MKKSRFTDSQIIAVLKQAEAGTPVPELCREHGISSATFYKWREALQTEGAHAFRGSGRRSPQQQELAQLRKQVARLEQENTILKKATAYFASASKRGTPGSTDND